MLLAAVIVLLTGILSFVLWCLEQKRKFRCLGHIPGPKPLPVLGSALEFGGNPVEQLKAICRMLNTYGNINKVWIGPKYLYLLISDPEFTEFLLSSPKYMQKSRDYDLMRPWLANGLLTSTGSYWQKRRKAITPTFHFKILEEFIPIFSSAGEILIEKLSGEVGKDVCDIYPYITSYALDNICETAMGTTVNAQQNHDNEYVKAVKTVCNIFMDRTFSVWKMSDTLFKLSSDYKTNEECLKILHDFTDSVIKKRREELLAEDNDNVFKDDDIGAKRRVVFLDLLLKATIDGKPLTNDDIREEVDTFMFEGHDTTASAICFALYELARNPVVQDKLVTELRNIFADDKNRKPTLYDLNEMKYLDLVIKETLRLYPSVPFFARELAEDAIYKGDRLPKGLTITIVPYFMHRRPDLWKDPETFNPERFLDSSQTKSNFAYIPFSAGPRNCIGQKFAMYETKSALCKIIRNFEVSPADSKYDVILSSEVILKSKNGVNMRLKHRDF